MLGTCPDVAYAVAALSQHAANPLEEHLDKALYICQYLLGTCNYSLVFDGTSQAGLIAYTDSDQASDHNDCHSQTGWFFKLANCTFSCWCSHKQEHMANSSTEAEYVFLSDCGRQAKWLWQLLGELGYNLHPIPVCGDNQSFIFMASNPVTEARSKHIDIKWHSIWELVSDKIIELFFVEGAQNPAVMRASQTVEEREQRVLQSRMQTYRGKQEMNEQRALQSRMQTCRDNQGLDELWCDKVQELGELWCDKVQELGELWCDKGELGAKVGQALEQVTQDKEM